MWKAVAYTYLEVVGPSVGKRIFYKLLKFFGTNLVFEHSEDNFVIHF